MTNSGEVFAGLDELNECEDCLMFPAILNTDGISFNITWLGICLWQSEEDEREFYEEKNEWEPLGQYLIHKQLEVFKDIESELNQRGKAYNKYQPKLKQRLAK